MKNITLSKLGFKLGRLLSIIYLCFTPFNCLSTSYPVSQSDALRIAMAQFPNEAYDYYLVHNDFQSSWTIFVDAYPMASWDHECYTVIIPKTSSTPSLLINPGIISQRTPPSCPITPLVLQEDTSPQRMPIRIQRTDSINNNSELASKTYAIIISGGLNKEWNFFRYWSDCSLIYQVLTKKYNIPKSHIFPIMADGDDPAEDTKMDRWSFCSQDLDLDGDGEDEISMAATISNIQSVITSLTYLMNENDHLFVYVIDHGGRKLEEEPYDSYIWLWNDVMWTKSDFVASFIPFKYMKVNVNMVLGQCCSGDFVEDLTQNGFVISAGGSIGEETSPFGQHNTYDSFVYNWTCAINNADEIGRSLDILVDTDQDGHISVWEAFQYAKVREGYSHPMYSSTPFSLGEELAFDRQPPLVDLYIKDNPEDTGKEPNYFLERNWLSPSIVVRNQDDSIFIHQNPYLSTSHRQAYIYVKVHNRGKNNYTGGKHLMLYWAYASAGFTQKAWKGLEYDENNNPLGGIVGSAPIGAISWGDSTIVKVPWNLPGNPNQLNAEVHACLLARIMDTPYDDGYQSGVKYFKVKDSNDQAQKNITLINSSNASSNTLIFIRNPKGETKDYSLEIIPHHYRDSIIFSEADVEITLTPNFYTAWSNGGLNSVDVTPLNNPFSNIHRLKFNSYKSKLLNIRLTNEEFVRFGVRFNFNNHQPNGSIYDIDLIQRDEFGEIIGGETFKVETPIYRNGNLSAGYEVNDNGVELSVNDQDLDNILWYDNENNQIGKDKGIIVPHSSKYNEYHAIGINQDGEMSSDSVLVPPTIGIKSIHISDNLLNVYFYSIPANGSSLEIINLSNQSNALNIDLNDLSSNLEIDISSLCSGVYAIAYLSNGITIDSKTFIKP